MISSPTIAQEFDKCKQQLNAYHLQLHQYMYDPEFRSRNTPNTISTLYRSLKEWLEDNQFFEMISPSSGTTKSHNQIIKDSWQKLQTLGEDLQSLYQKVNKHYTEIFAEKNPTIQDTMPFVESIGNYQQTFEEIMQEFKTFDIFLTQKLKKLEYAAQFYDPPVFSPLDLIAQAKSYLKKARQDLTGFKRLLGSESFFFLLEGGISMCETQREKDWSELCSVHQKFWDTISKLSPQRHSSSEETNREANASTDPPHLTPTPMSRESNLKVDISAVISMFLHVETEGHLDSNLSQEASQETDGKPSLRSKTQQERRYTAKDFAKGGINALLDRKEISELAKQALSRGKLVLEQSDGGVGQKSALFDNRSGKDSKAPEQGHTDKAIRREYKELSSPVDTGRKRASGAVTLGKREPNEDAFFSNDEQKSYGVFDGLGGQAEPHIASTTARDFIQFGLGDFPEDNIEEAKDYLKKILLGAHEAICKKNPVSDMATTATVAKVLKDRTVLIGNMGGSRAYLYKRENQTLEHLTVDNDYGTDPEFTKKYQKIQKTIAGLVTFEDPPEDLRIAIQCRHQVYNILGNARAYLDPRPVIYQYQTRPRDILLLTTDGVHDNLTDKQIVDCITANQENTQKAAEALIRKAKQVSDQYDSAKKKIQRSKKDDITAIVVQLE